MVITMGFVSIAIYKEKNIFYFPRNGKYIIFQKLKSILLLHKKKKFVRIEQNFVDNS